MTTSPMSMGVGALAFSLFVYLLAATLLPVATRAQRADARPDGMKERIELAELAYYSSVSVVIPADAAGSLNLDLAIENEPCSIQLRKHSLRTPDFKAYAIGASGTAAEVPHPETKTYRGEIVGLDGSSVAASLDDHGLTAAIFLPDRRVYWIQPRYERRAGGRHPEHVIYSSSDLIPRDERCGVENDDLLERPKPGSVRSGRGTNPLRGVEVAFDADYEYFQDLGSSIPAVIDDIMAVMNVVDEIYRRPETSISHRVTSIVIRTSSSDPYTSSNGVQRICQMRDEWTANQGGVVRDIAHLMTGVDLDGTTIGYAWNGVVCRRPGIDTNCSSENKDLGYGLSQSRFSTVMARRAALTAHEFGHNWSADHCDADPQGCNIMCSSLGGCSGVLDSFAATPVAQIQAHKSTRGCLDPGDVWVDVANAAGPWDGSQAHPYRTVLEGVHRVAPFGRLFIATGVYDEAPATYDNTVTFVPDGAITIR